MNNNNLLQYVHEEKENFLNKQNLNAKKLKIEDSYEKIIKYWKFWEKSTSGKFQEASSFIKELQETCTHELETVENSVEKIAIIDKYNKELQKKFLKDCASYSLMDFTLNEWLIACASKGLKYSFSTHPSKFINPDIKQGEGPSGIIAKNSFNKDGFLRSGNVKNIPIPLDSLTSTINQKLVNTLSVITRGKPLIVHLREKTEIIQKDIQIEAMSFDEISEKLLDMDIEDYTKTHYSIPQVYFPVKDGYHLLSVLSSSPNKYALKQRIQDLELGGERSGYRKLKKGNKPCDHDYSDLLDITIIKYGGANPINISKINSKANGKFFLLPSVPPTIRKNTKRLPKTNFFKEILGTTIYKTQFQGLTKLYSLNYTNTNKNIRQGIESKLNNIIDNIIKKAWDIRKESPGWSDNKQFVKLPISQKIWLDDKYIKERGEGTEWLDTIIHSISHWIYTVYNTNKTNLVSNANFLYIESLVEESKGGLL